MRVTELEPKLNYPFPTGDYVTLGGLIHHRLGRIAKAGDLLAPEGARLEVQEMDNHRIIRVLIEDSLPAEEDGDAGGDNPPAEYLQAADRAGPVAGSDAAGEDKVLEFDKGAHDAKRTRRT